MKERERTQSMHFTHEYAKAQSEHLEELCRLSDEEYERLRIQRSKSKQ